MASKKQKAWNLYSVIVIFLYFWTATATNIDCGGKPFHCLNSSHFMICVDLGSGISQTVDDKVIQCPATTVCRKSNRYECEYQVVTTTQSVVRQVDAANESNIETPITTESTAEVTPTELFTENFNTVSVTTQANTENVTAIQQVTETPEISGVSNNETATNETNTTTDIYETENVTNIDSKPISNGSHYSIGLLKQSETELTTALIPESNSNEKSKIALINNTDISYSSYAHFTNNIQYDTTTEPMYETSSINLKETSTVIDDLTVTSSSYAITLTTLTSFTNDAQTQHPTEIPKTTVVSSNETSTNEINLNDLRTTAAYETENFTKTDPKRSLNEKPKSDVTNKTDVLYRNNSYAQTTNDIFYDTTTEPMTKASEIHSQDFKQIDVDTFRPTSTVSDYLLNTESTESTTITGETNIVTTKTQSSPDWQVTTVGNTHGIEILATTSESSLSTINISEVETENTGFDNVPKISTTLSQDQNTSIMALSHTDPTVSPDLLIHTTLKITSESPSIDLETKISPEEQVKKDNSSSKMPPDDQVTLTESKLTTIHLLLSNTSSTELEKLASTPRMDLTSENLKSTSIKIENNIPTLIETLETSTSADENFTPVPSNIKPPSKEKEEVVTIKIGKLKDLRYQQENSTNIDLVEVTNVTDDSYSSMRKQNISNSEKITLMSPKVTTAVYQQKEIIEGTTKPGTDININAEHEQLHMTTNETDFNVSTTQIVSNDNFNSVTLITDLVPATEAMPMLNHTNDFNDLIKVNAEEFNGLSSAPNTSVLSQDENHISNPNEEKYPSSEKSVSLIISEIHTTSGVGIENLDPITIALDRVSDVDNKITIEEIKPSTSTVKEDLPLTQFHGTTEITRIDSNYSHTEILKKLSINNKNNFASVPDIVEIQESTPLPITKENAATVSQNIPEIKKEIGEYYVFQHDMIIPSTTTEETTEPTVNSSLDFDKSQVFDKVIQAYVGYSSFDQVTQSLNNDNVESHTKMQRTTTGEQPSWIPSLTEVIATTNKMVSSEAFTEKTGLFATKYLPASSSYGQLDHTEESVISDKSFKINDNLNESSIIGLNSTHNINITNNVTENGDTVNTSPITDTKKDIIIIKPGITLKAIEGFIDSVIESTTAHDNETNSKLPTATIKLDVANNNISNNFSKTSKTVDYNELSTTGTGNNSLQGNIRRNETLSGEFKLTRPLILDTKPVNNSNSKIEANLSSTDKNTLAAPTKATLLNNNKRDTWSIKHSTPTTINKESTHYVNKSRISKSINTSSHINSVIFSCNNRLRGRYADKNDCRKFYICIGKMEPLFGACPVNTVFSEIKKQCTKNLSHCMINNQFHCIQEGRFCDLLKNNLYYICVKNKRSYVRFQFQCQDGYHLNKTSVRCDRDEQSQSQTSSTSTDSDSNKTSDRSATKSKSKEKKHIVIDKEKHFCNHEGRFPHPDDCKKYYMCSKHSKSGFRRRTKKCDSDEVFHREKKKCVNEDSYECE